MGSKLCILNRSLFHVYDTVYFSVRCVGQCSFTLRLVQANVTSIDDQDPVTNLYLDARSMAILPYQIPQASPYGSPTQVTFQALTPLITATFSLQLAASLDFYEVGERYTDVIVEGGKALKFTKQDPGWCDNCTIYLIIDVRIATTFTRITSVSSTSFELIPDQVLVTKSFSAQQEELKSQLQTMMCKCLPFFVIYAVNEVSFLITQNQGDAFIYSNYRNLSSNLTSNQTIMISEISQKRQLIIRSQDRQIYGPADGLLYLCVQAFTPTSLDLFTTQSYSHGRLSIYEDVLTTFQLDSQDGVYFRFTSPMLINPQAMQVQLQSFNGVFNVPLIYYTVCAFQDFDECSLDWEYISYDQSVLRSLTALQTTVDAKTKIRSGVINHSPINCPNPASCIYMIAVFNNQNSGFMKQAMKISFQQQQPIQVKLFDQYYGIIDPYRYEFFQFQLSQSQAMSLNVSTILVNLTSFNGVADLYASQSVDQPSYWQYEYISRSLSPWNSLEIDVSGLDLSNQPLFVSVFTYSRAPFRIQFNAVFKIKGPQTIEGTPVFNSTNTTISNNSDNATMLVEGQKQSFNLSNQTNTTVQYYPKQQQVIVIITEVKSTSYNSSLTYDITYGSLVWKNLTGNKVITPDQFSYDPSVTFNLTFYALIPKLIKPSKNQNQQSILSFGVTIYQVQYDLMSLIGMNLNQTYTVYATNNHTVMFNEELLDTNGTYQFALLPLYGSPVMMYLNGPNEPQFNASNNATFYQEGSQNSSNGYTYITSTPSLRQAHEPSCKSASYALNGGNNSCTMWIGVSCSSLCLFKLEATLQEAATRKYPPPALIRDSFRAEGTMVRGQTQYYYLPYKRDSGYQDGLTFLLNKVNNDSILIARIINNPQTNYWTWNFPNNGSFDYISRSGIYNPVETLQISNSTLTQRCGNPYWSCVLIIGVIANALSTNQTSTFALTLMNNNDLIQSTALFTQKINSTATYWFIQPRVTNWSYVVSLKALEGSGNIFVSVIDGRVPNASSYDYMSNRLTTDVVVMSSNDPIFQKYSKVANIIVVISVEPITEVFEYQFYINGPTPRNSKTMPFNDIQINQTYHYSLPGQGNPNNNAPFLLFRYFNYGPTDLRFNLTCTNGAISYLANIQLLNDRQSNIFFNIPLEQQTSIIPMTTVNKGQSSFLAFDVAANSQYQCTFCWYFIAVFQNSTNMRQTSDFMIQVVETTMGFPQRVPVLEPGLNQLFTTDSTVQRKFLLNYKTQFGIVASASSGQNFTVYVSNYTENQASQIISTFSASNVAVFVVNQIDPRFSIGKYYYLTIYGQASAVDVTFNQARHVELLRDGVALLDRMETPQDQVKFYYYLLPNAYEGYTANFTVRVNKPGWLPNLYVQQNSVVNGSVDLGSLSYPTMFNYSLKQEFDLFAQPLSTLMNQSTFTIKFAPIAKNFTVIVPMAFPQNKTVSQVIQQNITTYKWNPLTRKNETIVTQKNVTVQQNVTYYVTKNTTQIWTNQTFYTLAIYWINYGLTDETTAEYEVLFQSSIGPSAFQQLTKSDLSTKGSQAKSKRHWAFENLSTQPYQLYEQLEQAY